MFGKKFFKVAFHRTIINTNSHMSFLAYFRETFLPLLNNITKFSLPFYGILCYGGEQ